jgi:hypothetical protein
VHHLPAMEVVGGRLLLWRRGCWQSGPGEAARAQGYERATVLEHCSAGSLDVRLIWCVEPGARLFAAIRLSTGPPSLAPASQVAVWGVVRCAVSQPDGRYGVGVACTQHRFL